MAKVVRPLLTVVVLGALAAGGYTLWRERSKPLPPAYTTVPADRGTVVAKVTATGTLSALVTVQVGVQVSGRIQELMADFNSPVKKGQVLAKLDPALFGSAVEQARANLLAARGNLAKAKAQAEDATRQAARTRQLAEKKLVALADAETADSNASALRAAVEAADGQVAQAQASLHQAEINLQYTTVYSPIDGVVISRAVDVGQTVAASLQAPTLFTIAEDLGKMQVDTSVAEADVGKLTAGLDSSFTVDAYPGQRFHGAIRQIRNAPQTVQNVVTYDAVIDVQNADLKLRPGMTANVTFAYATAEDTLRVPNAALRFRPANAGPERSGGGGGAGGGGGGHWQGAAGRPDGGWPGGGHRGGGQEVHTVYVLRAGQAVPVPVQVGLTDGSFTAITGGELKEGDLVITEGPSGDGAGRPAGGSSPLGGPQQPGGMRRIF